MPLTRGQYYDTLNRESAAVGYLIQRSVHYFFKPNDADASWFDDAVVGQVGVDLPDGSQFLADTPEALLEFLAGVRIGAKLMPDRTTLIEQLAAAKARIHGAEVALENAKRQFAVLQTLCPCLESDARRATTMLHIADVQCGVCDKPRQPVRPLSPTT